ncbi:MAG: FHA domain-containing protein [Bradymonadaceae bacterium]
MVDPTSPDEPDPHSTLEDRRPESLDGEPADVFGTVEVREDYVSRVGEAPEQQEGEGLRETDERSVYAALTARRPEIEARVADVDRPRFLIGRGSVDLALDDPFVSPWHAQLYRSDGSLLLEDMDSENGVYLRLADDLELEDGDEIAMGRQRFVFRTTWDTEAEAEVETVELGAPARGRTARLERRIEGGGTAGIHPIGDSITIGREGTILEYPRDALLADSHAVIVRDGDSYFLNDLDTDTGTFIRIHNPLEVVDGDCFLVGRTRIDVAFK